MKTLCADRAARHSAGRDVEELVRVYAERSDVPVVAVSLRSFGDGPRGGFEDGGKAGGKHAAEAERTLRLCTGVFSSG
jgi:hypothetical protein